MFSMSRYDSESEKYLQNEFQQELSSATQSGFSLTTSTDID